jgi:hypothetical protein
MAKIDDQKRAHLLDLSKDAARKESEWRFAQAKYAHELALELLENNVADGVCLQCGLINPPEGHLPCQGAK